MNLNLEYFHIRLLLRHWEEAYYDPSDFTHEEKAAIEVILKLRRGKCKKD